ncbi:hypothetical protein SIID45300_00085 [Candidatus Magnetaquicoccaceae bacterium FCR-1]|uniref:Uncharacterized protein n=1 Tax=Candidatus Magnetaquiglobus chichijimensis TaxID=3141448 RepID=A0ABQ0C4H5_9PROT
MRQMAHVVASGERSQLPDLGSTAPTNRVTGAVLMHACTPGYR